MFSHLLQKQSPCTYVFPRAGKMLVDGLIIASPALLENSDLIEKPLEQIKNVAMLPGIVGYSIAMPDMHWGYGFPIGGVAAMDAETGVISPGGVGYDINCGVRLALLKHPFKKLFSEERKQVLLDRLFSLIPSGVGHGRQQKALTQADYKKLFIQGASWSIEQGYGLEQDLDFMESHGRLEGAEASSVSELAQKRGASQLGTIGSGNHFVEVGEVDSLFHPLVASQWDVHVGDTYILIHSGSRGLGHQVCQDTLNLFIQSHLIHPMDLPDKQLIYAPIRSPLGQHYFQAMAAAANYAFNNRQQILHAVRTVFFEVFRIPHEEVRLLYDVCHNIAKFEEHMVEGKKRTLCVHRKGATRACGIGHQDLSPFFQKTGQPVLVPGDMGTASYLLVGTGNSMTWCSCCHGAGRSKSRIQSMKSWIGKDLSSHMKEQGVLVKASSFNTIAEEMPDAYKDIDEVVDCVEEAHLAQKVAKLKPHLVIKG